MRCRWRLSRVRRAEPGTHEFDVRVGAEALRLAAPSHDERITQQYFRVKWIVELGKLVRRVDDNHQSLAPQWAAFEDFR